MDIHKIRDSNGYIYYVHKSSLEKFNECGVDSCRLRMAEAVIGPFNNILKFRGNTQEQLLDMFYKTEGVVLG